MGFVELGAAPATGWYFLPTVEDANMSAGDTASSPFDAWEGIKPLLASAGLSVGYYESWKESHWLVSGEGENASQIYPSFSYYAHAMGYEVGTRNLSADRIEYRIFRHGAPTQFYTVVAINSREFDLASKAFSSYIGGMALAGLSAGELGVASATPDTTGVNMFDDFDSFDPAGFSDGEAAVAFSDAQVVDFGFPPDINNLPGTIADANAGVDYGDVYSTASYGDGAQVLNNVPEISTSDYGTVFEPSFGEESIKTAVSGVKLATAATGAVKSATSPQRASGGATGAKQQSTGSNDILAQLGQALAGVGTVAAAINQTGTQKTTAVNRAYAGQLDPAANSIMGVPTNTLLLVAGGLIALAFVLKA